MSRIVSVAKIVSLMSLAGSVCEAHQQDQPPSPRVLRNSNSWWILQFIAIKSPIAIRRVEPVYPPLAKAGRISGSVVVEVMIDESGNVTNASALLGHPLLKDAAVQAAREWKFAPVMLSGVPVKLVTVVTFSFAFDTVPELESEVHHHPGLAEAHSKLAAAYYRSARYSDSALEAAEAMRINPDVAGARLKLGESLSKLKRNQEAIVYLEQAARLAPSDLEAQFALGVAFTAVGRYEDALGLYLAVLKKRPTASDGYFYFGDTYSAMGRYDEAIDSFNRGLQIKPERWDVYVALGQIYLKLGRTIDAIVSFKHAVTHHPFDADVKDAVLGLGLAHVRSGDRKAAMDAYSLLKLLDTEMASRLLSEIEK